MALTVALVAVFVLRRDVVWQGSAELHTVLELIASLMALGWGWWRLFTTTVAKPGCTCCWGRRLLDGYHTIVTSAPVAGNLPSELPALIAWSWIASRWYLSAFLCLGWIAWRMEGESGSGSRLRERHVFAAGALLTLGEGEWERDYEARFTKSGDREVIAIVRDVTDRKVAERALMEARDEAEQANRAKSDFLSSMSHELRTPLNSVLGFSQLPGRDTKEPLSESQQVGVEQIEKAGRHLLTLIDEVLDLAQTQSGHLSLSSEPVEIGPLLGEALKRLKGMEETSSIPAITLSADAMPRQIEKGLAAGFVKYLTKPIDVTSFLEAIDEVLGDEPE